MDAATTVGELGEERIIALFAGTQGGQSDPDVVLPNGDDAAAWRFASNGASVATTDSLVEHQHFDLAYATPEQVGAKLMAVNLSDLAAVGARPRFTLLSVCFPSSTPATVAAGMAAGIRAAAEAHAVVIVGGNVTGTRGPIVLTAVAIGEAAPAALIGRRGARPGDGIFVTGTLGDAAAGLHLALAGGRPGPEHAHARLLEALVAPTPRVEAGLALARTGRVHAMCDVSDGLGRDVRRLLGPLGARLERARLPLSDALLAYAGQVGGDAATFALTGGEDYELVMVADPPAEAALIAAAKAAATPLRRIGIVTDTAKVEVVDAAGHARPAPTGFEHFEAQP